MPLYEFRCPDCGAEFEELVGSREEELAGETCPSCQGPKVERKISSIAAIPHGGSSSRSDTASCAPGGG